MSRKAIRMNLDRIDWDLVGDWSALVGSGLMAWSARETFPNWYVTFGLCLIFFAALLEVIRDLGVWEFACGAALLIINNAQAANSLPAWFAVVEYALCIAIVLLNFDRLAGLSNAAKKRKDKRKKKTETQDNNQE